MKICIPMLILLLIIGGCSQKPTSVDTVKEVVQFLRESDTSGEIDFKSQDGSVYAKQEFGMQPPAEIRGQIRIDRKSTAPDPTIPVSEMMRILSMFADVANQAPSTQSATSQPSK